METSLLSHLLTSTLTHHPLLSSFQGRARTADSPVGVALDRSGRFGCFAVDSVFNIFSSADPVAYQLNATVDADLGRAKEPMSIPSAAASTLDDFSQSIGAVYGSVEDLVAGFNFNLNVSRVSHGPDLVWQPADLVLIFVLSPGLPRPNRTSSPPTRPSLASRSTTGLNGPRSSRPST